MRSLVDLLQLLVASCRDLWAVVVEAMPIVGVLVLARFATEIGIAFVARGFHTDLAILLVGTLGGIAFSWISAPYLVALYRFLILNQLAFPSLLSRPAATERFFAWSATLNFAAAVPGAVVLLMPDPRTGPSGITPPNVAASFVGLGLLVVFAVFLTRVATLLPATAIGAAPSLDDAMRQTSGHFWFILLAIALVGIPFRLLLAVVSGEGFFGQLLTTTLLVLPMLVAVCVSSRLYLKLSSPSDSQ